MVQFVKALSTILSHFVRLSNYVIYCCFLRSPQQLVGPMGRIENVKIDGPWVNAEKTEQMAMS